MIWSLPDDFTRHEWYIFRMSPVPARASRKPVTAATVAAAGAFMPPAWGCWL